MRELLIRTFSAHFFKRCTDMLRCQIERPNQTNPQAPYDWEGWGKKLELFATLYNKNNKNKNKSISFMRKQWGSKKWKPGNNQHLNDTWTRKFTVQDISAIQVYPTSFFIKSNNILHNFTLLSVFGFRNLPDFSIYVKNCNENYIEVC
jgi:hypothetical protein